MITDITGALPNSTDVFLNYEHKCQSEVIRQMKGSKVIAITLDPITEKNVGEDVLC